MNLGAVVVTVGCIDIGLSFTFQCFSAGHEGFYEGRLCLRLQRRKHDSLGKSGEWSTVTWWSFILPMKVDETMKRS